MFKNWSNLKWIVFEESDRVLDMGFQKEMEEIIQIMNTNKVIYNLQYLSI